MKMDSEAERLLTARNSLGQNFANLNTFVNAKGSLELLDDTCQKYRLDFEQKMTVYTGWLKDPALSPGHELKVALKMSSDFNDYCKDHYYRFKKKWTIGLYGSKDTDYGNDALIFTHNWYLVFTALDEYIYMLKKKTSWSKYLKSAIPQRWVTKKTQDTQQVHHLLQQLKQCIEES